MSVVATQKTTASASSKTASKTSSSPKPAQKSFETRVNEALKAKDAVGFLKAVQSATAKELQALAKNASTLARIKQTFDISVYNLVKSAVSNPKSAWEQLKKMGGDALNWLNHTVTGAVSSHVSPKHIMDVYSALSVGNVISNKTIVDHISGNKTALTTGKQIENATKGRTVSTTTGYIENQSYGNWDKIKYGSSNLSNAGCGIFATFNVMKAVTGVTPSADDLVDIITNYERSGAIANGMFGTSPKAVASYLKKKGYSVLTVNEFSANTLNTIGNSYKGFITLKLNDKADITAGGHYESISKAAKSQADRNNDRNANDRISKYKFSVHNGSKRGPHSSMPKTIDVINSDNAMVFCILAVNKAVR